MPRKVEDMESTDDFKDVSVLQIEPGSIKKWFCEEQKLRLQ